MPHVIVKMRSGRSAEQKQHLATELADVVVAVLGVPDSAVSVGIEDVEPGEWVETVYEPDLREDPTRIFKQPGYTP